MKLHERYRVDADKVSYRRIDDEAVILNLENGHYYSLNNVAANIWDAIGKKNRLNDILKRLKTRYRLPEKRLQSDLCALVSDLEEEGLIKKI